MIDVATSRSHVTAVDSGSYPPRAGNLVRPLVDGLPAFRRICQAIDEARHSVWCTVVFIDPDFRMPDGRGSLFDVLDHAADRGLDVRVIFWRHQSETAALEAEIFSGSKAQRHMLRARGARFRARWDRAPGAHCHHQKSWLIDAGHASETAFVGGINLTRRAVALPGHVGGRQHHDVYVEVAGPSASDVHHNFVQRWNEASDRAEYDGVWGHDGNDELAFPARVTAGRGASVVQIQRTVHPGCYRDGHPAPGGHAVDIAGGERSILDQYLRAIDDARRSIYIENQALHAPEIVDRLHAAVMRGVDVVMLVPADPERAVRLARREAENRPFFARLAELGRFDHFTLTGVAGLSADGLRTNVYVHSKIMLIDDEWATIGSCNLRTRSLLGHTEMNAAIWDASVVRSLRCQLFNEHLHHDTSGLDDRAALAVFRHIARDNRVRCNADDVSWQGLAVALDPATYGEGGPSDGDDGPEAPARTG